MVHDRWGREGDAVEVVGDDDVVEDLLRLGEVGAGILVALGEVGEDERARPGLGRDPGGLGRGEVAEALCEVGVLVQEGRFADEEVGIGGELDGRVAVRGVHDEREDLAGAMHADFVERDGVRRRPG